MDCLAMAAEAPKPAYTHRWKMRRVMPQYFNQLCRIIQRVHRNGTLGVYSWGEKVTVEFIDGTRLETTRNCLRAVGSLHHQPRKRIG